MKPCTIVLADGKSLEKREVLFCVEFEQQAFNNLKYVETCQAQSDQGIGTWYVYTAECQTPGPPDGLPVEHEKPAGKKPVNDAKEAPLSPLEMEAEAKAIGALGKLGGTCTTRADVVGKPVVGVQFVAAPIRGSGLGYREMAKEGMKEFKAFSRLKSLKLDRTDVTDESMKDLKDLKTLQSLDLSHTQVANVGLKQLKELKSLQALVLGGTTVTDAGLKELKELKNLVWLDLSNTRITDVGLKELANFKNLQELDLSKTKVTEAGVAELRKALPKLHVSRR